MNHHKYYKLLFLLWNRKTVSLNFLIDCSKIKKYRWWKYKTKKKKEMRKRKTHLSIAVYIEALAEGGVDSRWGGQGGYGVGRTPSYPPQDPHRRLVADAQPRPLPPLPSAPVLASLVRSIPLSPVSPSSASSVDSETISWSAVPSGIARVPSRSASAWWGSDSCGIPFLVPAFDSACRFVGRACAVRSLL